MKNAKVTITYSGQLTVNLEDTGGMVDEEIKDRAMEEIAINPDALFQASEFKFDINRF